MSLSATEVDVLKHILEGITAGKGTPGALVFLEPQDLINLGKILADREAQIDDLFSAVIEPISSFHEGFIKGDFDPEEENLMSNLERIILSTLTASKRVYFVPIEKKQTIEQIEILLKSKGLKLCANPVHYLLGALAMWAETHLPSSLDDIDIVAINKDAYLSDPDSSNDVVFSVSRVDNNRKPDLRTVTEFEQCKFAQIVLAEKM